MMVVPVVHLLNVLVLVVVAAVADVLPAADPVAGIGHGVGDWRVGLSPAPDSWIPADGGAILEMAPLPFRATPRKRTAPRAGVATQGGGMWRWRKAQVSQGWSWQEPDELKIGRTHAARPSVARSATRAGKHVAATRSLTVAEGRRAGQAGAAAVAAVIGQLHRGVVGRTGACYLLQRQGESRAKGVSRSAGLAVWQGNQGCRVVSVHHLLDDVEVDQDVIAPVGFGFRLGRRERYPQTPLPYLGTKRGQTLRSLWLLAGATNSSPVAGCPAAGRDQLPAAERRPAEEGLEHSNRRTAQREKGFALQPVGPRCLQRATSNPQRQRIPSWAGLAAKTRAEGETPRFLRRETWQSLTTHILSAFPAALHSPCAPHRRKHSVIFNKVAQKFSNRHSVPLRARRRNRPQVSASRIRDGRLALGRMALDVPEAYRRRLVRPCRSRRCWRQTPTGSGRVSPMTSELRSGLVAKMQLLNGGDARRDG